MERTLEPEVMDTAEAAEAYDAMDHQEPNRRFVDRLLELGARGEMLDIGTGPGGIPILLCEASEDAHVLGIDLSQQMLDRADAHRLRSKHSGRMRFELADAKRLRYDDASFDAVFSNTILHHIPEPASFVAEAARVLRPGGVLLIRDLYRPHNRERVEEIVAMYTQGQTEEQRGLFRDSLHAALTPGELRVLADSVGLERATLVIDTDRHMSLQLAGSLRRRSRS